MRYLLNSNACLHPKVYPQKKPLLGVLQNMSSEKFRQIYRKTSAMKFLFLENV